MTRIAVRFALLSSVFLSVPAHAELPEPVIAMIRAAESTGDPKQVAAVHAAALGAYPDEADQLKELKQVWDNRLTRKRKAEAEAKENAIRRAGLFDFWEGKGELGALRSTGNSNDIGVSASLALARIGIDWRHKLKGQADYLRSDGETTRERFLAAYEPSYDIGERAFVYGLGQAERDRIQGFSSRYSVSGGIGYRIIERDDLKLEVKGGPAWRQTDFLDDDDEEYIAGLAAMDLSWTFAKNLTLTQVASAFVQSENSTYTSLTGLQAGIGGGFSARLSYRFEHDTSPPDDSEKTDTQSRVTLIYDF
ncbi:DUF481 domain-containing protein [Croceicoccus naphthovorans]|uniref:Uncharacterized protein n=1 Tax=Croceicoccus naphthovorans TaxID=1348774 RepID=A0A0G3XHB8_9SPHN|nr:DUF481 domain-containing protein [Croceicoccus naphthovorans]AKM09773.1 hypothetical protein AB433_06905 [Croceicoccus naphthovorans]MBB3990681.1 putative salt-induced outer membrane protein [Croceicoccus naphthovorans]